MTKFLYLAILLLGTQGLTACTQLLLRQTCVALSTSVNYCLAPLPIQSKSLQGQVPKPSMVQSFSLSKTIQAQKISLKVGLQQHELLSQIEVTNHKLTMVGLAPIGHPLFTLIFDGKTLTSEQNILLGEQFKPEYLMAIMQLIYWPESSINSHLSSGKLVSMPCSAVHCRYLYESPTPDNPEEYLISINYTHIDPWRSDIHLKLPSGNFELKIIPL